MAKFLCVCDGGNVRSRALAYVLHDFKGHEAIPLGRLRSSAATIALLSEWADVIVVMQPHMAESIPETHKSKVKCVDVGPDRYGVNVHPELMSQVSVGAERLIKELKA